MPEEKQAWLGKELERLAMQPDTIVNVTLEGEHEPGKCFRTHPLGSGTSDAERESGHLPAVHCRAPARGEGWKSRKKSRTKDSFNTQKKEPFGSFFFRDL